MWLKILLICLFLCWITPLSAQRNRLVGNNWNEGVVYLTMGDSIKGNIQFDLQKEIVQVESEGKTLVYPSSKIFSYQLFDKQNNRRRIYKLYPYQKSASALKNVTIFEVMFKTAYFTLLGREKTKITYTTFPDEISSETIDYDLYILDEQKRNINLFKKNRKQLLYILRDEASKIEEYMEQNSLRIHKITDLIKILSYYTTLKSN